jgi:hypothetical protein
MRSRRQDGQARQHLSTGQRAAPAAAAEWAVQSRDRAGDVPDRHQQRRPGRAAEGVHRQGDLAEGRRSRLCTGCRRDERSGRDEVERGEALRLRHTLRCHRPARPGDPVSDSVSICTPASGILGHPLSRVVTSGVNAGPLYTRTVPSSSKCPRRCSQASRIRLGTATSTQIAKKSGHPVAFAT